MDSIFYCMFLSVGSFAFTVLLSMVYYSKNLINTLKGKIFRFMLFINISNSIFQILLLIFAKNLTNIPVVSKIFWGLYMASTLLFWLSYLLYFFAEIYNIQGESIIDVIKHNKMTLIYTIVILLGAVGLLFSSWIPFIGSISLEVGELDFLPNICKYICILLFALISIPIIILGKKEKIDTDYVRTEYMVCAFVCVLLVLQTCIPYVSFLPLGFSFITFLIYFYIENPDLAILKEINNAQGEVEKSNQTKTDFLSNMTYEIKTPMNLIVSLCDELMNMPTFDEQEIRSDVEQIQTSGNNLLDIINNILDISKIETGKGSLQEKDYKVNDLISDVVNITKQKIGAKPVKLIVNIDQSTSSVLNGDSSKLYQVLINICSNAAKYTDVGRITITLTSTKSNGVEHLVFKVTDTGTGIKEEDRDKLFTKFNRLDNAKESDVEGSGLGLVITKQYVDLLGGKIWFDTQYRVGTTFYIDVPQKIVDATPIGSASEQSSTGENAEEKLDCSAFKALIVDDNLLNIKVAKRLLEKYKFQIESVTTGKECVYKIKEDEHFDVIFMDHMMPEMDGIETLHVLKKLDGYTLPPIVALTANAIAGMKEMYLQEGFDDYLSKPINTRELDRIVSKFFKK